MELEDQTEVGAQRSWRLQRTWPWTASCPSLTAAGREGRWRRRHDLCCDGSCKEHSVIPNLARAAQLRTTVDPSCRQISACTQLNIITQKSQQPSRVGALVISCRLPWVGVYNMDEVDQDNEPLPYDDGMNIGTSMEGILPFYLPIYMKLLSMGGGEVVHWPKQEGGGEGDVYSHHMLLHGPPLPLQPPGEEIFTFPIPTYFHTRFSTVFGLSFTWRYFSWLKVRNRWAGLMLIELWSNDL